MGQKRAAVKLSKGVIAGTLVMLVAACGGNTPSSSNSTTSGSTPNSADAPTAPASRAATTTPPNLTAELLAAHDLPLGWSAVGNSDAGEPQCLDNVRSHLNATGKAEATFVGGSSGVPTLEESLFYVPGQAHSAVPLVSRILSGCGRISLRTGGQTLIGTVGSMPFPAVADESSAYQMNLSATVSGQSVTFVIDVVVFRKADTVAMILYADLGTPDTHAVQPLIQDAAAKLS